MDDSLDLGASLFEETDGRKLPEFRPNEVVGLEFVSDPEVRFRAQQTAWLLRDGSKLLSFQEFNRHGLVFRNEHSQSGKDYTGAHCGVDAMEKRGAIILRGGVPFFRESCAPRITEDQVLEVKRIFAEGLTYWKAGELAAFERFFRFAS